MSIRLFHRFLRAGWRIHGLVWLCAASLGLPLTAWAQLSPGPLAAAHAELEGLRNCTLCHELGQQVSSQKCLACHDEIQGLITQRQGYHASAEVRRQDCIACHSDHHGRTFDMARFDEAAFDHRLTGYTLEGAHAQADCRACHQPAHIADADLRGRKGTFLGMDDACLSCHADYHQETLGADCRACHDMKAFTPAPGFDHGQADFVLRGAHQTVDCEACHPKTTRQGEPFQQFTGLAFGECVACHDDPHAGRLFGACTACHNEQSFTAFTGGQGFAHSRTGFELRGQHQRTDCFACHARSHQPRTVFGDQTVRDENACAQCHDDQHEGRFGLQCAECHNERDFLALNDMSTFNHNLTDYPLEGKHQAVDCRQCHETRFSTPIDFSACQHCHTDYHQGEFADASGQSPDCARCHAVTEGFDFSLYTLDDHQQSAYPLAGAHLATPCFACHLDESSGRWAFREIGNTCVACHGDTHAGFLSRRYYPEQDCERCHVQDTWTAVDFDHGQTGWPLEGQHRETACRACHFEEVNPGVWAQHFDDLGTDCAACHDNVHGDAFAIDGVTDCARCHGPASWFPEHFDHNQTAFPLDGRHAEIDCMECHRRPAAGGGFEVVYKIERFACIDCHQ